MTNITIFRESSVELWADMSDPRVAFHTANPTEYVYTSTRSPHKRQGGPQESYKPRKFGGSLCAVNLEPDSNRRVSRADGGGGGSYVLR